MRKIAILAASLSTAAFGLLFATHAYIIAGEGVGYVRETGV